MAQLEIEKAFALNEDAQSFLSSWEGRLWEKCMRVMLFVSTTEAMFALDSGDRGLLIFDGVAAVSIVVVRLAVVLRTSEATSANEK